MKGAPSSTRQFSKNFFLVKSPYKEALFFDFCLLFPPFPSPRLLPFPSLLEPDPVGSDKVSWLGEVPLKVSVNINLTSSLTTSSLT